MTKREYDEILKNTYAGQMKQIGQECYKIFSIIKKELKLDVLVDIIANKIKE